MNRLPKQGSFDTTTMVSVRSNTKFFKAVKEEGFQGQHLSMPVGATRGINVNHMPLNQIPFRLTQHPHLPFTITASDNALYQEMNTKERQRLKKEKVEDFYQQTCKRVNKKVAKQKQGKEEKLLALENHIKNILNRAIEFSMETNMIEKTGTVGPAKSESPNKSVSFKGKFLQFCDFVLTSIRKSTRGTRDQ